MTNEFEALPIEVTQSALTTNQKKLLEVFVLFDGLEKTKENGCFFASNADLMLKSGIGSHHTLTKVIRSFELNKFITRNVGSFEGRQATTYALDMEAVLNWCESHPIGAVSKRRKSASIKSASIMGAVSQKCLDEESAKVAQLEKKIIELEAVNKALVKALSKCGIEAVEKAVIGAHIGAHIGAVIGAVMEKCPTDTEKETTNHIVTSSNSSMGLPICVREDKATFKKVEGNDPDEVAPSNEIDQTGDVCDFNKKSKDGVDTFQPEEKNNEQGEINPNGMTTPDDEQIINPNGEVTQSQPDEEINKSQATANKADQSLATPQMGKLSTNEREHAQIANKVANPASGNVTLNAEERIKQLEALNLQNRNTPNVNPIELAEELGNLIVNDDVVYQSRLYNRAIALGSFLVWYANDDIDTINEIERLFMCGHIKKYGTSHPTIVSGFAGLRNEIAEMNANKADQSHADTSDEETIIQSDKAREIANKAANPVAQPKRYEIGQPSECEGVVCEPQPDQYGKTSPEAHQTHGNGQVDSLPTQSKESDQTRPESPTMAMEQDDTINNDILQLRKANKMYRNNDENASRLADKTANHIIRYIPKIDTVGKINWCRYYINRAFEQWGWVLESSAAFYLDHINKKLDEREAQLLAA